MVSAASLMIKSHGPLVRAFSFGMPKCGTTTIADMLANHPEICLHNQKEPGDFLAGGRGPDLSGYRITVATRYILDFTTSYGIARNRNAFFGNLRAADLKPETMRYVLCVREPSALARSYLTHMVTRRRVDLQLQLGAVREEILEACEFTGAVESLHREAGIDRCFLVHFEDLVSAEGQQRLADGLFEWLGLEPWPGGPVWSNSADAVMRYPARLNVIASAIRGTRLVRRLPPAVRRPIRTLFSRPVQLTSIEKERIQEIVEGMENSETVAAARDFLCSTCSGPLGQVVKN